MAFEHYVRSGNKMLRLGYTTGTCAALASYAAAVYALTGSCPKEVSVVTPRGMTVEAEVASSGIQESSKAYFASVIKDAGDDADATNGIEIEASVRLITDNDSLTTDDQKEIDPDNGIPEVMIRGGKGVGTVTKPGLDQPVGESAINSTPRKMIKESILRAITEINNSSGAGDNAPDEENSTADAPLIDPDDIQGVEVTISIPEGEAIAKKTFNPVIGIEGGISVIGTSGIVDPMSEQALIDTIEVNMKQVREESEDLILTPGNYGEDFLKKEDFYSLGIPVVKCSNFIGNALDIASTLGFRNILLVAHIGKLSKIAAGVMNTHSRYADSRREVFTAYAALNGGAALAEDLMAGATTDAYIETLDKAGIRDKVIKGILDAVQEHLERRAEGNFDIGALTFSNVYGVLGYTDEGKRIVESWKTSTK